MPPKDQDQDKKVPEVTGTTIEQLFRLLAMQAAAAEDKPINETKPMEEYKFWKTQPVVPLGKEVEVDKEGPIEIKTVDQVSDKPSPLPAGFEWCTVDISDSAQINEVYDLLYYNYVEDSDEDFRFKYSPKFLQWGLQSPGWNPEWMVGVKVKDTGKIVGFISGIPSTLKVRDNEPIQITEINFLCVHKKLRSKRLAPVLIREVTRRVNRTNVWQALYTAGRVLPSPVSTARYFHRPLNWTKLLDANFVYLPPDSSAAKESAKYALPKVTSIPNIRVMTKDDIPQVKKLFDFYQTRFDISPVFTEEELEHWLIDPIHADDEKKDTVYSYVIHDEKDKSKVTDFFSFFGIESSVLSNPKIESINVAYCFYYGTKTGISDDGKTVVDKAALTKKLTQMFHNCVVLAKNENFDVLNALTVMDNPLFMEDLQFKAGDGYLRYYLFNYKTFPVTGGIDNKGKIQWESKGGVGALML